MTSQVEVPPLTGLIHFISGKRRVNIVLNPATVQFRRDSQKNAAFHVKQLIIHLRWYVYMYIYTYTLCICMECHTSIKLIILGALLL